METKTREERKRRGCILSLDIGRIDTLNREDMILLRRAMQYFNGLPNHEYNDPEDFVSTGRDNRMYCNAYVDRSDHQGCPLNKLITTIERDDRYSPSEEKSRQHFGKLTPIITQAIEERLRDQIRNKDRA